MTMSGPSYVKQPTIQRLPNQFEEIRNGHLLIPRFQRPFVWTDQQRLALLDSVYKGMPIGSILVWRTYQHKLECYDRLGPLEVATQPPSDTEVKQYLLDGHQRLTTLYVAFHSKYQTVSDADTESDEDSRQWPICFDLENKVFKLYPRNGKLPQTWVPLSILFDYSRLFPFLRQLHELANGQELGTRAEGLASIFKDYSIAVVPIVTEDLEVVTESFQRINSAGTPMSQMHMVNALTWSKEFDLHKKFQSAREELGEIGWQELEDDAILNACKIEFGLDIYANKVGDLKTKVKETPDIVDRVTTKLSRAANFLRDHCGIHGPHALPYRLQLLALAHALPEAPSQEQIELMKSWFWITTYTEYLGSGINYAKLALALEHIRGVIAEGHPPMPPDALTSIKPIRVFFYPNGRARALVLNLVRLGPKTSDGPLYNTAQLLGMLGNDAVLRLLHRRHSDLPDLGKNPANRFMLPRDNLTDFRSKLAEATLSPEILDSHAIPAEAAIAFASQDYETFLRMRWQALLDLEEKHVTSLGLSYVRE
jgi:hypothetical protein